MRLAAKIDFRSRERSVMNKRDQRSFAGHVAMVGGTMGLLLAPMLVIVKYMTGWAVIPQPLWVRPAQEALSGLLQFATPPGLWMVYGTAYTIALLCMLVGLLALAPRLRHLAGRAPIAGYWIVIIGMCLVIPGDAIHTWTWHQGGLTTPTPGTNPLANTAYAVHMMGMNFIMVGSMVVGVSAVRRKFLTAWLAWSFVLIFPSALLASVTILPTTPSGALWWLSAIMVISGYFVATGQSERLVNLRVSTRH